MSAVMVETVDLKVEHQAETSLPIPDEVRLMAASLAEEVRQHGDVLDRLAWLRRLPAVGSTALTGAGIVGLHEGFSLFYLRSPNDIANLTLLSGAAIATGMTLAARLAKPLGRKQEQKKAEILLTSEPRKVISDYFDGEPVEFYRTNLRRLKNELSVFWQGPAEEDGFYPSALVFKRISGLAAVAEAADASEVVVPTHIVANFLHGVDDKHVETRTQDEWLYGVKNRLIRDVAHGNRDVTLLDKEALPQIIENARLATTEEPLDTIMQLIASHRPNHPSLRKYYAGIKNDPKAAQALEASLRRMVNARLDDTDVARVAFNHGEWSGTGKQKRYLHGSVAITGSGDPFIRWQRYGDNGSIEKGDLLAHFGTSQAFLERLPELTRNMPSHRALELCELAALLTMHDKMSLADDQNSMRFMPSNVGLVGSRTLSEQRGLQRRIAERVISKNPAADATELRGIVLDGVLWRRLGRSVLNLALAFGLGAALSVAGQAYADHRVSPEPTQQVLDEKDYDSSEEFIQRIKERASDPLFDLVTGISEPGYRLERVLLSAASKVFIPQGKADPDNNPFNNPEELPLAGGRFGADIGNVILGPNQPLWYISPYGGASTNGYWAEATYNDTLSSRVNWGRSKDLSLHVQEIFKEQNDISNEGYYAAINAFVGSIPALPSPESLDTSQPLIRVERLIAVEPTVISRGVEYDELGWKTLERAVPVPVLEGTKVVAGKIGESTPIRAYELPNGTTSLIVTNPNSSKEPLVKLEYWLAPSDEPKVRATSPITEWVEGGERLLPPHKFDTVWEDHLSEPLAADPAERVEQTEAYIESFGYTTQPIKDDDILWEDPTTFTDYVLDGRKVNCNVANTVLALSNPSLNYVTGFRNSNTDEQKEAGHHYLSMGEGHAWTVDPQGKIQDATPSADELTAEERAYFEENFTGGYTTPLDLRLAQQKAEQRRQRQLQAGLIGGALALLAITQRRRLAALPKATRRTYAAQRLERMDKGKAALAYEAANHVLYAGKPLDGKQLDVISDQAAKMQGDVTARWQQFVTHHGHETLASALNQSVKHTARPARKALRRAKRVVKLVGIIG